MPRQSCGKGRKADLFGFVQTSKFYVNDIIMTDEYPLHDMESLFHELEGSKFHVKSDLFSAYYEILLDDAAQDLCVINTTVGLFKLLRLPQGIKKRIRNVLAIIRENSQRTDWNFRTTEEQKVNVRSVSVQFRIARKTRGSPLKKSSLEISWRKSLISVSQFKEEGLSPRITLSEKSGKSILLNVLRKSNSFVDWSPSTASSSRTSHRKLPHYLI